MTSPASAVDPARHHRPSLQRPEKIKKPAAIGVGADSREAPRITFGMIVLNGEPFVRYNLRSLYPWAHQIIVVEGACRTAKAVATQDGHSIDGTMESLRRFQQEEDPENKVVVVHARDEGFTDGFWPEKTEMCQAFAKRATGNYLWQIDSDEFYREEDMPVILRLLEKGTGWVTFPQHSFWGGIGHTNNSLALAEFDLLGTGARLFAWGKGYRYVEHRPPTVVDDRGQDVRAHGSLSCRQMKRLGIHRYHYCLVFPSQVFSKVTYYSTHSREKTLQHGGFQQGIASWHEENFKNISRRFHMHNLAGSLSWVRPFRGRHPAQITRMMDDIRSGRVDHDLRPAADLDQLMQSTLYRIETLALDAIVTVATGRVAYPLFRIGRAAVSRGKAVLTRR